MKKHLKKSLLLANVVALGFALAGCSNSNIGAKDKYQKVNEVSEYKVD